jgi:hypothetical protein
MMRIGMTLTKTLLALLAAGLVVGCGGGTFPTGPIRLAEMRADSRPYYWVGDGFEGLKLTHAEPYDHGQSSVTYGTCEMPTGLFAEGACRPPLTVLNLFCANGHVTVTLISEGGGRAARAASALQPLNEAARKAGRPPIAFWSTLLC